jgi:hypothetical protein
LRNHAGGPFLPAKLAPFLAATDSYTLPGTFTVFRLRRYNGSSHRHTNSIESETMDGFHIHTATERYQLLGGYEDHFAEPTDRYGTLDGAIECMLSDCGFDALPASPLFRGTH